MTGLTRGGHPPMTGLRTEGPHMGPLVTTGDLTISRGNPLTTDSPHLTPGTAALVTEIPAEIPTVPLLMTTEGLLTINRGHQLTTDRPHLTAATEALVTETPAPLLRTTEGLLTETESQRLLIPHHLVLLQVLQPLTRSGKSGKPDKGSEKERTSVISVVEIYL